MKNMQSNLAKKPENVDVRNVEFYLPLDCPSCGRRRLIYRADFPGRCHKIECEKCYRSGDEIDSDTEWMRELRDMNGS